MNKKNKGFTTIELITSFTLASVIMLILFNIILILKDNLSEVNAKTNMLVEKDNLSYNINKRFKEKELSSITMCNEGDKCYEFKYSDDTSDRLVYSIENKSITFNNYTFDIIDGITVEEPTITEHYDTMSSTTYNGYFIINIPIKLDNKDYSIKINKHFNTDSLVIDIGNYWDYNGNRYILVNYLESTGTQYIDTGFKVNNESHIIIKVSVRSDSSGYLFGAGVRGRYVDFGIRTADDLRTIIGRIRATSTTNLDVRVNNVVYDDAHNYEIGNSVGFVVDDEKKGDFNNFEFLSAYNLYIFCWNSQNNPLEYSKMTLYSFKINDGDTLVRDYIPVIDSSERPCLFDKVSRECYYNQGTGEFLYG